MRKIKFYDAINKIKNKKLYGAIIGGTIIASVFTLTSCNNGIVLPEPAYSAESRIDTLADDTKSIETIIEYDNIGEISTVENIETTSSEDIITETSNNNYENDSTSTESEELKFDFIRDNQPEFTNNPEVLEQNFNFERFNSFIESNFYENFILHKSDHRDQEKINNFVKKANNNNIDLSKLNTTNFKKYVIMPILNNDFKVSYYETTISATKQNELLDIAIGQDGLAINNQKSFENLTIASNCRADYGAKYPNSISYSLMDLATNDIIFATMYDCDKNDPVYDESIIANLSFNGIQKVVNISKEDFINLFNILKSNTNKESLESIINDNIDYFSQLFGNEVYLENSNYRK